MRSITSTLPPPLRSQRAGALGSTQVVLWIVRSQREMLSTGLAAVRVIRVVRRGRVGP